MHPALTRYVDPPRRYTARHVALGAAAGTLLMVAALLLADHVAPRACDDGPAWGHSAGPDDELDAR